MDSSATARQLQPTPCELNDWEWCKFKADFNLANWEANRLGQRRLGIALIGLGRIGLVHMRNLLRSPRAKLLYCFDIDQTRLDACRKWALLEELGTRALHSDQFRLALEDPGVHAIVVASPTATHERLVRAALEAKKCVLCEKPLTLNQANILDLYELAHSRRVFLATAFNRHYDSDWQRMRRRAKEGCVGPIQLIRIISRNGQRPSMAYLRASGNCFYDTAIHDLDMMLWLMGQLPSSVRVVATSWRQFLESDPDFSKRQLGADELALLPQISDYFLVVITLQFANGSIGLIDTSRYSSYGNDQRCEIYGSRGMIKSEGQHSSNVCEFNESGITNPGLNFTFESRYAKAYEGELDDFLTMADLASGGHYERAEGDGVPLGRRQLVDFPRGSLVAAATRMAQLCSEAARANAVLQIKWPADFERKFYEEIQL